MKSSKQVSWLKIREKLPTSQTSVFSPKQAYFPNKTGIFTPRSSIEYVANTILAALVEGQKDRKILLRNFSTSALPLGAQAAEQGQQSTILARRASRSRRSDQGTYPCSVPPRNNKHTDCNQVCLSHQNHQQEQHCHQKKQEEDHQQEDTGPCPCLCLPCLDLSAECT